MIDSVLERGANRYSLHCGVPFNLIRGMLAARKSQWRSSASLLKAAEAQLDRYPTSIWRFLAQIELAKIGSRPRTGITQSRIREFSTESSETCRILGYTLLERSLRSAHDEQQDDQTQGLSGNFWGVTLREAEVMSLLSEDYDEQIISERLGLSVHTVRAHIRGAMTKTGSRSRGTAIGRLIRAELI